MNSRVAIYARVSTSDQSTESQLLDLRRYVRERGWTLFNEYTDNGVSGTKDSRPALNQLMDAAKKRRFDTVLVWRFDRFARSTKHLILALEEFRGLGIDFVSYQENIDTSSPPGKRNLHHHLSGGSVGKRHHRRKGQGGIERGRGEREEVRPSQDQGKRESATDAL